ncbi:MAG: regulatory iron-sulfur-containing complex subunit RicT [Candidatus Delongbacteria bacterium]|jgi:cell fate regulator YaaT (PSP1 superfamily)|nr:regulatory iron-sulfur-containing complex subunit RicT [Candidatus Delongbacteria bacterium]
MEKKSNIDINKDILSPTSDIAELDTTERKEFLIETNFKGLRKSYFLNPKAIPLKVGEFIIVDFENGEDMGVVSAIVSKQLKKENIDIEGSIIRKSNPIDVRRLNENRTIENNILINARKQAKAHDLEMKFIDIEYKFDRKKLVFFFTADGRVDFRELVKTFAGEYKTRIELRQIGVRDEAQKIGGIGICGRELCCSQFLTNFVSINVSMARDQNLFVKPEKFSGPCGKLICCLKYEHDFYLDEKKGLPEVGTEIQTKQGKAVVSFIDVFNSTVSIDYRSGESEIIPKEVFLKKLNKEIKFVNNASSSQANKSNHDCKDCPQKGQDKNSSKDIKKNSDNRPDPKNKNNNNKNADKKKPSNNKD